MNGSVLAALVAAALIVAFLLWKKKSPQTKADEGKPCEPPAAIAIPPVETATEAVEPATVQEEESVHPVAESAEVAVVDEGFGAEGVEIPPEIDTGTEPLAPLSVTTAAAEELDQAVELQAVPALDEAAVELAALEPAAVDEKAEQVDEPLLAEEASEDFDVLSEEPVSTAETVSELPTQESEPAEADAAEAMIPVVGEAIRAEHLEIESPTVEEASVEAESPIAPEPEPSATTPPVVRLTLEAYSARLNSLEDRQRELLAEAIARRDDDLRDRLQRELVIMNDKLALIADSYVEEMACYQQVLETLQQLRAEMGVNPGLETAMEALCNGETEEAETFLAGLSGQPHPLAARAAHGCGLLAECRVDLQRALALHRQAVEQEPANPRYLQAAGRTARSLYYYKEALPWLESFVQLTRQNGSNDPLALALAQRELAYTYVLSGQFQKAGPLYKEAMTALAKKLGQDHPEMATSWRQIGELQETLGEYDKAVSLYKKALEILEKKRGPEHPVLAGILAKLAALCMELEMEKEAVPLYERLVRIQEKALRPTHPQRALSLNSLAESYRLQGRYADAFACYQKSLEINETLHGPEHPSVAAILQELAKLCASQRRPDEAKAYQDRAAAIFQKSVEAAEKKSGKEALTLEL